MIFSIIVACNLDGFIGLNNKIPWHCSDDLKYFKKMTLNKPIIMGRKTYESIGSKCLPNRFNIVLSNTLSNYSDDNLLITNSKEEIILKIKEKYDDNIEVMVIGGLSIYELYFNDISNIYLNMIYNNMLGDTSFPNIDLNSWKIIQQEDHVEFKSFILAKNGLCKKNKTTNFIFPFHK